MRASVIVVNWRQPELTLRALDALARQVPSSGFEVVLVENEARPGGTDVIRRAHPEVIVVEEPTNSGFAGGVARGIAAATGDVIVLVNNDAVPDPGFVAAGLAALDAAGPTYAAVSAAVMLEGLFASTGTPGPHALVGLDGALWARTEDPTRGTAVMNGTGIEMTRDGNGYDRDWLAPANDVSLRSDPFGFSGGAAFLRRDALDAVGGFDDDLFMYYEDLDVSWRFRLAGLRIGFAPEARIVHRHAGSSSSGSELIRRQSIRNRLAVVLRNGSATFIIRVVLRTLARLVRDTLNPGQAYLSRDAWRGVLRELPGLVAGARRKRRADRILGSRRREVENLLG
ncbi:glycosyltransferase family 2 protein [Frondihabitans sp. VKM Ac-2883]|uniref:glycosyltransferase family 2 protein n=1 Tax=Frondihabitans sp. VKM Ac-2883 TaxID=2783823 RepID=UPI00188D8169|nr:glycosyltransferase family 2 protein [Frondihabitans sp. VKM Ac-2883]MBF4575863.1 glycosyltransferase family 2 protein [Frondihabitans sp. VKM Ac-2883]